MPAIKNASLKGFIVLAGVAVATAAIGFVTSAQLAARARSGQEQTQTEPGGRRGFGRMGRGMMGPGGPGMRGGPGGPLGIAGLPLRGLGLTDAQREQVEAVMDSHRDEQKAIGERMMTARKALRDAVEADAFNDAAIRAAAAEVGGVEADAAVLRARLRAEVFALLTPEQVQKVKDLRSEMESRMKDGRGRGLRPRPLPPPDPRAEDGISLPETV